MAERYSAAQVESFYRLGFWRHETLWDYLEARAGEDPDSLLVTDGESRHTFGEVLVAARAFAGSLAVAGVTRGDRVVLQMENVSEFVIACLGIARLGAVMVPQLPIYRDAEVRSIIHRTGATAYVGSAKHRGFDYVEMLARIRPACPTLRLVVIRGGRHDGCLPFEEACSGPAYTGPRPASDDVAFIVFTSGTEARSKGCTHTFNTWSFTIRSMGAILALGKKDVCFMPSPLAHTSGLAMGLYAAVAFGLPLVLQDQWDPVEALRRVQAFRCTYAIGATPFIKGMVEVFESGGFDASSLRVFGCGGAPVPSELVGRVKERMGTTLVPVFGQTETLVCSIARLEDDLAVMSSTDGRAVDGVEIRIATDGVELPRGEIGEVQVRGPGVMLGYLDDPELTARTIDPDGWLHTSDLGRMDERGYIRITGRVKDIIIRGGLNISALEVESILGTHPKVRDVAVTAMPDAKLGEKVCAFVVSDDPALALEDLTSFMLGRGVAKQKLPERLVLVEQLPRNPTGKLQKFKLAELL
jgi:cyclohexanecarboxylate-CoA ligase/acyl-CoA synthetase